MGIKREIFPFLLMLFVLLPTGYYFAGSIVYNGVAFTNTDCWGNFDQNTPQQFAPLRNEIPLNESENSENISSNIMTGLSQYGGMVMKTQLSMSRAMIYSCQPGISSRIHRCLG